MMGRMYPRVKTMVANLVAHRATSILWLRRWCFRTSQPRGLSSVVGSVIMKRLSVII